jgi:hypothetical protein
VGSISFHSRADHESAAPEPMRGLIASTRRMLPGSTP